MEFDAFKELIGGKIIKIGDAFVFPSVNNLIIENNGKYYKLTSESLIDVQKIEVGGLKQ